MSGRGRCRWSCRGGRWRPSRWPASPRIDSGREPNFPRDSRRNRANHRSRRDRRSPFRRRFPRPLRVAHPPLAGRRPDADPGRTQIDHDPRLNQSISPPRQNDQHNSRGEKGISLRAIQQKGLSARRIELASVRRSLGSRARHCPMTVARGCGTSGRRVRIGTGCSSRSMRIRSPPPACSS